MGASVGILEAQTSQERARLTGSSTSDGTWIDMDSDALSIASAGKADLGCYEGPAGARQR